MRYTREENDIIRKFYKAEGAKGCARRLPGRSTKAITFQAAVLGVRSDRSVRGRGKAWTTAEIGVLQDRCPVSGIAGVAAILVNRTPRAIAMKCCELGIRAPGATTEQKRAIAFQASLKASEKADADCWPVKQTRVDAGKWKAEPVTAPRSVFEVAA